MIAEASPVRAYLEALQDRICSAFERLDGGRFDARVLEGQRGGQTRPHVLSDGELFERAAVIGTSSRGDRLPPAATERKPELTGRGFEATSLSLIVHPRNPYVPTVHANLRFFVATHPAGDSEPVDPESVDRAPVWWFGGGFDLTPYYGFEEDARHWHRVARRACAPFGQGVYPRLKRQCDDYFYLPHRGEPRGVGGLFFDDLDAAAGEELFDGESGETGDETSFERCFGFVRSVGDHFLEAYQPLVERRRDHPWGEREREFQLYRRGRYVEFNLAHDRGTRYGLQVGGRAESILASLPPLVTWKYDWSPPAGSDEERLYTEFLVPRDWAEGE